MTLITLVTTGEVEKLAAADFLRQFFPNVEFRTEFTHSFTSARIPTALDRIPTNASRLAARLVAAVDPGRKRSQDAVADFAIAVDDLELFNADQPERVVEMFAKAVTDHVHSVWPSARRQDVAFSRLRERASFHVLAPMMEAYFYTSDASLSAAGISASPQLISGQDLESFRTDDPTYAEATTTLQDRTSGGRTWSAEEWYSQHPKHYLNYLIAPAVPYNPASRHYRESVQGVNALRALDRNNLLRVPQQQRFLRSLISDVADALQLGPVAGDPHPATYCGPGQGRLLRNI
jgi:hypothetical protein